MRDLALAPLAPGTAQPCAPFSFTPHGSRFTADRHGRGPASRLVRVPFAIVSVLVLVVLHMCAVSVKCVETLTSEKRLQRIRIRTGILYTKVEILASAGRKNVEGRSGSDRRAYTQRPPRTAPHSTPCSTRNCAPPRTSHNDQRPNSVSDPTSESHGTGELRVRTTSSSRRGIGFTFTHQTSAQTETPSSIDGRRKCTGGSTTDGIQSESTHPIAHCMLLPAPTADAIAHSFILVLLVRHVGEDRSTPPGRCACLHRTWRPWR